MLPGHFKEFWDQFDGKTLAVNVKEVGHEEEMNQDVNDFIDFSEDLRIIIEKDLWFTYSLYVRLI